jgi:hypothetical protein
LTDTLRPAVTTEALALSRAQMPTAPDDVGKRTGTGLIFGHRDCLIHDEWLVEISRRR